MGLCKCERKQVTDLFCFAHRVNVCEFCLISKHPQCVVKSYLRWLKDSDFDPSCNICKEKLDSDSKACVRLICLHVFHWNCLDEVASSLPPTTTPAGYLCPTCDHPIMPHSNHGGPIAETLRRQLDNTTWAKTAFERLVNPSELAQSRTRNEMAQSIAQVPTPSRKSIDEKNGPLLDPRLDAAAGHFLQGDDVPPVHSSSPQLATDKKANIKARVNEEVTASLDTPLRAAASYSNAIDTTAFVREQRQWGESRNTSDVYRTGRVWDEEDKYKRRPAFDWLSRFIRTQTFGRNLPLPVLRRRRTICVLFLLFMCLVTVLLNVHHFRKEDITGDPFLDPNMNPNLHRQPPAVDLGKEPIQGIHGV